MIIFVAGVFFAFFCLVVFVGFTLRVFLDIVTGKDK